MQLGFMYRTREQCAQPICAPQGRGQAGRPETVLDAREPAQVDRCNCSGPSLRRGRGRDGLGLGFGDSSCQRRFLERLAILERQGYERPGAEGISKPWHPAKGPGGGPAQAPRGGTSASRGTQNTARGTITPLRLPASTPAASAGGGASAALLAAVAGRSGAGTQIASPGAGGAPPVREGLARPRRRRRCFRRGQPGRRRWRASARMATRQRVHLVGHAASGFDTRPGGWQLPRFHARRFGSVWALRAG